MPWVDAEHSHLMSRYVLHHIQYTYVYLVCIINIMDLPARMRRRTHLLLALVFSPTITHPVRGAGGGNHCQRGRTHFMHGRSRTTIDPRTPTMLRRSTWGFHRPGKHDVHQPQSAVKCSASRMEGDCRFVCLPSCLPVVSLFSGVATSREGKVYTRYSVTAS